MKSLCFSIYAPTWAQNKPPVSSRIPRASLTMQTRIYTKTIGRSFLSNAVSNMLEK